MGGGGQSESGPELSYNEFLAGGLAGAAGLIVGHPFDTAKVQLQTQQVRNTSTWQVLQRIGSQGAGTFFRGLGFPLGSSVLRTSFMYGVYANTLIHLARLRSEDPARPSYFSVFIAGTVAGVAQIAPACPIDIVKVVLQSQIVRTDAAQKDALKFYRGPVHCAKDIFRRSGVSGFYKGLTIMLHRDSWATGLWYVLYDYLYRTIQERFGEYIDERAVTASLIGGGLAGLLSWSVVIPIDVIKTRYQADVLGIKYKTVMDCVRISYRKHGAGVFFKGFGITCIRAFPVNAAIFGTYQQTCNYMRHSQHTDARRS